MNNMKDILVAPGPTSVSASRRKELAIAGLLSLCWALALFDIVGIDYLMPFIAPKSLMLVRYTPARAT